MATIKDIARELNLSISTVSLALNDKPNVSDKVRQEVLAKAKELNYRKNGIAATLKLKKTNLILFILNDASRPFFASIIEKLQQATSLFNYDFLICPTYNGRNTTAERFIKEHRADAIIVYTSTISDQLIQENSDPSCPIIVLGRHVDGDNVFSYDRESGSSETLLTTDYLLAKGMKRIAFVKGSTVSLGTSRTYNQYLNSLKFNNIPLNDNIVFEAKGASYQLGYNVTKDIIIPHIKEIDAIQYSTDINAIGGMSALKDSGIRVPNDISVVGKNNIIQSSFTNPSLTTVGSEHKDNLFYESLIHYISLLLEKDNDYDAIAKQLHTFLSESKTEEKLIIRDSTKND